MSSGPTPSIKVGDRFTTNEGYVVEVIEYNGRSDIVILFENKHTKRTASKELRKGSIKNPFHRSVCGIGYIGAGEHKTKVGGKSTSAYHIWHNMVNRCYCPKSLEKRPTYQGCSVCDDWLNFQNFAVWYEKQPNAGKVGFDLDKDLLVLGNKVYSPQTCSLVPQQINKLLSGRGNDRGGLPQGVFYNKSIKKFTVSLSKHDKKREYLGFYDTHEEAFAVYKREKEKFVREQAEKYKDVLHPKVYENLMNWSLNDS